MLNNLLANFCTRLWTLLVYLLVMFILSAHTAGVPAYAQGITPRRAFIFTMQGSVLVQASGQATAVPARRNMEIKSGDRIITGKDGTAELKYDDGSISRIGPGSRIDIANLSRQSKDGAGTTILNAQRGSIWNNAKEIALRNSRFQVNTPAAVASVRGTNFLVRVQNALDTLIRVYDGRVGATPASGTGNDEEPSPLDPEDEMYINSFQQAGFGPDAPPRPEPNPIDPLDVDEFEKDNLVEDQPAAYIEIESEAKTILLTQAEEKLLQELHNLAVLGKELELITGKLAAETDPAKLAQLKSLLQLLQKELENRREIVKNIDQERQALAMEKEKLNELKERLDTLTPEQLKEQVKAAREEEKQLTAERAARERERAAREQDAAEALLKAKEVAEELGLSAELQQAGEGVTDEDILKAAEGVLPPEPPATSLDDDYSPTLPTNYALTIGVSPTAAGTVTGAGSYAAGTEVTLTAIPAEGYEFAGWSAPAGTFANSSSATTTFNMPAQAVTITACFRSASPELIINPYVLPWNYEDNTQVCIKASETGLWQQGDNLMIRIGDQPVEEAIVVDDCISFNLPAGLAAGEYVIEVLGGMQSVLAAGDFHVVKFAAGSGTDNDPYIVETPLHLDLIRYFLNSSFKLNADIDLGIVPYNAGAGWQPVGNEENPFTGTIDGNRKIISNLFISKPDQPRCFGTGLFGYARGATIKDIALQEPCISGNYNVGSLVGYAEDTEISMIEINHGTVTGLQCVGGLAGVICNTTVTGTTASPQVSGKAYDGCGVSIGGIIGCSNGESEIFNVIAAGDVYGINTVGGLAGEFDGIMENSFATGSVEGNSHVGGLVGFNYGGINGCHACGNVKGEFRVGGLVGCLYSGEIIGCHASGIVQGENDIGGLVGGQEEESLVKDCASLNENITRIYDPSDPPAYPYAGRIIGYVSLEKCYLINNHANANMLYQEGQGQAGTTMFPAEDKRPDNKNGLDLVEWRFVDETLVMMTALNNEDSVYYNKPTVLSGTEEPSFVLQLSGGAEFIEQVNFEGITFGGCFEGMPVESFAAIDGGRALITLAGEVPSAGDTNGLGTIKISGTRWGKMVNGIFVPAAPSETLTAAVIIINAAPETITGISVKTPPAKVIYNEGDALDLIGLVVTLSKSDSSSEDIALADFAANGIAASPADAAVLAISDTKVILTHIASGKSAELMITVNASDDGNYSRSYPAMAYDPVNDRYLMVYFKHGESAGDYNLYARFVAADGKFDGNEFPVRVSKDVGASFAFKPAVAYDSSHQAFLVVWNEFVTGWDIYGQIIDVDGSIIGDYFAITDIDDGKSQNSSLVAFDDVNNKFLVVYKHIENDDYQGDVYGRFVSIAGANPVVGEDIIIYKDLWTQSPYDVAFNGLDEFMIPIGTSGSKPLQAVNNTGGIREAYTFDKYSNGHSLAFDHINKRFLAVWLSGTNVYGKFMKQDGTADGEAFQINNAPYDGQGHVSVAYAEGTFYVVWEHEKYDNYFINSYVNIVAKEIDAATGVLSSQVDITEGANQAIKPFVCGGDSGAVVAWTVEQEGAPIIIGLSHLAAPAW